ncbi:hypothetical protein [Nannocystis exedens]|uniref:hypothetical protein n=1 Tax=Nannocystis exedens TaxID=54 RepID=UPI000BB9FD5B|nr:hypothetical protein [Nannocystis exedens]
MKQAALEAARPSRQSRWPCQAIGQAIAREGALSATTGERIVVSTASCPPRQADSATIASGRLSGGEASPLEPVEVEIDSSPVVVLAKSSPVEVEVDSLAPPEPQLCDLRDRSAATASPWVGDRWGIRASAFDHVRKDRRC